LAGRGRRGILRYVVALLAAGVVIAAVAAFSWWHCNAAERTVRRYLRQKKERGEWPPGLQGIDPETADLRGFNAELPEGLLTRVAVARLLGATWYVWVPAVVGVCLGVAAEW
jgi:hypothetical protein